MCFVCVFSLPFFPELSVIVMKAVYTDYHRLRLSTSRLCDQKRRKATRLEKPQNILKESFFTNYPCAGLTQNLIDGSSNVWKWINAAMQIETTGRSSKPILTILIHFQALHVHTPTQTTHTHTFNHLSHTHKTKRDHSITVQTTSGLLFISRFGAIRCLNTLLSVETVVRASLGPPNRELKVADWGPQVTAQFSFNKEKQLKSLISKCSLF